MSQTNDTRQIRIQSRVDSEQNWISNNPELLDREIGYTTDGKYKIGKVLEDGRLLRWNELEYSNPDIPMATPFSGELIPVSLLGITTGTNIDDSGNESYDISLTENSIGGYAASAFVKFQGYAEIEVTVSHGGSIQIDNNEIVYLSHPLPVEYTFKGYIHNGISISAAIGTLTFKTFLTTAEKGQAGLISPADKTKIDNIYSDNNKNFGVFHNTNEIEFNGTCGFNTGLYTSTGGKGYRITKIVKGDSDLQYKYTVALSEEESIGYEKNDEVSIRLSDNYDLCGIIGDITNNIITLELYNNKNLPTTLKTSGISGDINTIRVPIKPEIGNIIVSSCGFASGYGNKASGAYSFSEGANNSSVGKYSHTEGINNVAVYAAHAEGKNNKALGQQAHVEGWSNTAYGSDSHVEGQNNIVKAIQAHVEGLQNKDITGEGSHTEGKNNTNHGQYAHVEGEGNSTTGLNSHIEGAGNTSISNYMHIEGLNNVNTANANAAHIEGNGNTLGSAAYAHIEGQSNTITNGSHCHIEGQDNIASAWHNHIEGRNNTSTHSTTHIEGMGHTSTSNLQHIQGKYSDPKGMSNMAHIVGNGNDKDHPSNAHTLDWNGNAWFAGDIRIGGTKYSEGTTLATVNYVDNANSSKSICYYTNIHPEDWTTYNDGQNTYYQCIITWFSIDEPGSINWNTPLNIDNNSAFIVDFVKINESYTKTKERKQQYLDYIANGIVEIQDNQLIITIFGDRPTIDYIPIMIKEI